MMSFLFCLLSMALICSSSLLSHAYGKTTLPPKEASKIMLRMHTPPCSTFQWITWTTFVVLPVLSQATFSPTVPSFEPTFFPTSSPSTNTPTVPTSIPTLSPLTQMPTELTSVPSEHPTVVTTLFPTLSPSTQMPTELTSLPSKYPTPIPSFSPTEVPSFPPTLAPTFSPTGAPSFSPTPLKERGNKKRTKRRRIRLTYMLVPLIACPSFFATAYYYLVRWYKRKKKREEEEKESLVDTLNQTAYGRKNTDINMYDVRPLSPGHFASSPLETTQDMIIVTSSSPVKRKEEE